eukprot:gnl/TRDRNA2_/TRDRNA2_136101_c0_seq1.p1 gnl/TRDRNA2_/TRDRNA2_136101_c0~~gnl/TRDRNA2_/TRDRNA2_136101_c0_seq1.p1  ORF type:complete len:423 (+),score=47.02 gnl/TRDRNA2_/TRDRNA2_136101_c0_seq1:315-1583(+)
MIMEAMSYREMKAHGSLESYYQDLSEQWAFRHFTPSVLVSSDVGDDPVKHFELAREIDAEVAGALAHEGEPRLGIVWSQHVPDFRSVKFQYNIFHLTLAFSFLRREADLHGRHIHVVEVGGGYGNVARLLGAAKRRLSELDAPLHIQGYVCFDVRPVNGLQEWYLTKTLGDRVRVRRWTSDFPRVLEWKTGKKREEEWQLFPRQYHAEAPLSVDLVESNYRDFFVHLYGREFASTRSANQSHPPPMHMLSKPTNKGSLEEALKTAKLSDMRKQLEGLGVESAADILELEERDLEEIQLTRVQIRRLQRTVRELNATLMQEQVGEEQARQSAFPVRLVVAVNSWNEIPLNEYMWYFNEFFAGPNWRMAADWILYVSDPTWGDNAAHAVKESLLLKSVWFEVAWQRCSQLNCYYLLKRVAWHCD